MAEEPGPQRLGPGFVTLAGIGMLNAACLGIGMVLGWLVDRALGTTPIFLFVGLLIGVGAGVVGSYFDIRKYL
ncbi:MAG: AtpZ/AtpI family protein [Acidimicrobiales bacterium]